ncbi:MAG: flagellar basal-body rod protein FlgF [Rhodocyclaceae bacterium]|nr:flagellar basal-body rod protein FlgF [Rhodocyclaceae bacterium]
MDRLIYTAMTGAKHVLGQQAAVSHNLANATTTGFRAEIHRLRAVEVQSDAPLPTRAFVVDASAYSDYSQGPLQETGRAFDAAVQGEGWFAIQLPDGSEGYTRNGNFQLSPNGVLQTARGYPVLGEGGPITIPPDNQVLIGADGSLSAVPTTGAQNTVNVIDRLKLVNPPAQDLERGEDGFFRLRGGGAAQADEAVRVIGGHLEGSNVNVVDQMVNMISLARQFEMQTRLLTTAEQDDRTATRLLASNG